MPTLSFVRTTTLAAGLAVALLAGGPGAAEEPNPCNPCGAKNPCNPCAAKPPNPCGAKNACNPCAGREANPCAADNPCNPCGAKGTNPCSGKKANPCNPCAPKQANPCGAENPCNPCGAKMNPCGAKNPCNPCGAASRVDPAKFTHPAGLTLEGDGARLLVEGEKLWSDTSLSTNGAACTTCHTGYGQFLASFAEPYPHGVAMVKTMSGVDEVDAAEMVQFCMLQPMQAEPLPWSSTELAALATYVEHLQPGFDPEARAMKSVNPCNPCGARNPCSP